jgi:hypothetical protein
MNTEFSNDAPRTSTSQDEKYRNEDPDNTGEFYLESDHVALKGNGDYLNLLKTIAVLEAQSIKAIQVRTIITRYLLVSDQPQVGVFFLYN